MIDLIFTREVLHDGSKGYWANRAREVFGANPEVLRYVVSGRAPTRNGFRIVQSSDTLYCRKATGGKWGKSKQHVFVNEV